MQCILGTSYSSLHIKELKLDPEKSIHELLNFGFDIVRIGCYWSEIETKQNEFDFTKLHNILSRFEKAKQKSIVTLGIKGPRWPEFYIPPFARRENELPQISTALAFIEKTITEFKKYKYITCWQVENEPLNKSGPDKLIIPLSFLEKEVSLVKKLDPQRKIIINFWGNELFSKNLKSVAEISDIIGLDIYPKVPIFKNLYGGFQADNKIIKNKIKNITKPIWITELQAEPWEKSSAKKFADNPKSMNPEILKINFQKAKNLNPEAILFWGFEYWLWKKQKGDKRLWNTAKKLISN